MSLTLNVIDHWSDGKRIHVTGTLTPSGTYPTGGDTIPFGNQIIKSSSAPIMVMISPFAPSGDLTYTYLFKAGTTQANQKMKIMVESTAVEFANIAYNATQLANPAAFYAIFPKFI
jgi:hypothetical protein